MALRPFCCVFMLGVLGGCAQHGAPTTASGARSGIDVQYIDASVRPQDSLYHHMNGKWLQTYVIPEDRAHASTFVDLRDRAELDVRTIAETLAASPQQAGSEEQKIGDLYESYLDEAAIEGTGTEPLHEMLAAVAGVADRHQLAVLMASLQRAGVDTPVDLSVHQDNRDATHYIVDLGQSGLGLPDRDYYLNDGDARLKDVRIKYRAHVEAMLRLADAGDGAPAAAQSVVDLETALARVQWSKVENRDPVKTYNKVATAQLPKDAPGFDWAAWLQTLGVADKVDHVIVSQPSYLHGYGQLIRDTPLAAWKNYLTWQILHHHADLLPRAFANEHFAFYGRVVSGIPVQRPRWKRAVGAVEHALGEAVGKRYVAAHFPPESKARMQALVDNLFVAYKSSIDSLDWMSEPTKREAQVKLQKIKSKIGYPTKWRDYTALDIDRNHLIDNVDRAAAFHYDVQIAKLGKPVDHDLWGMTPQTVNAYYNPESNEIVFPAAILQRPFFDAGADDAVNYGGIGAVIGHEISHGFDDQGSQYDGDGNLRDWLTPEDHARFKARTDRLVAQYGRYAPVAGYNVNGQLTLGENIADNVGLSIAYKAYQRSLNGQPALVIDGMTGAQRFYAGWVQVWRGKVRDAEAIRLIKVDPHAPEQFRGDGALVNQAPFYDAYGVKPGDALYLPPQERATIW